MAFQISSAHESPVYYVTFDDFARPLKDEPAVGGGCKVCLKTSLKDFSSSWRHCIKELKSEVLSSTVLCLILWTLLSSGVVTGTTETTPHQVTMATTNPNPSHELTSRRSRRTIDLRDQSTFEMAEFIAARDERESALTAGRALIDEGTRSFAIEHYNQLALRKALDRLLESAIDRATARVLVEMALKNCEIYALKSFLRTWRGRQAVAQVRSRSGIRSPRLIDTTKCQATRHGAPDTGQGRQGVSSL